MRWPVYLLTYLILQVVAYLITPILPLFAKMREGWSDNHGAWREEPRLPKWLSWFDTPDNSLWGDRQFMLDHKETYLSKVIWLYRNSLYGFKWTTLACVVDYPNEIVFSGYPNINRNNGVTGTFQASYKGYWQWKCVKKLIGNRGIMFNFGWELDTAVKKGQPMTALFMFSPRFVSIK